MEGTVSPNVHATVIQSLGEENNSDRFTLKIRVLVFHTRRIVQERELNKEENNP
jgi:hypothetical protein